MSLLGSAFGRALAGGGAAAASIGAKFIDEEIAMNRAQAMAELQRTNAKNMRGDQAAFDDERAPVLRERDRQDALAKGATGREVKLATLNDETLTAAERARADQEAQDATRRAAEAAKVLTPLEVEKAGKMAEARARAERKFAKADPDKLAEIKRMEGFINQSTVLQPEEKTAAIKALYGIGKGEKGDARETTTEYDADGNVIGKKVVDKGKPGAASGGEEDPIKAAMDAARAGKDKPAAQRPGQPKPAVPRAPAPEAPPVDLIRSMSTRTLTQLANSPGHVNQQKAKAELERRMQESAEQEAAMGQGFTP